MHTLNRSMHIKIEERRKRVSSLLAQCMTESEIAAELGVNQATISRDVKYLKSQAQKWVYDLAKTDLAYHYRQSMNEIGEIARKAWESCRNDDNVDTKTKLLALRLARECTESKFTFFKDGPQVMHLKALQEKVDKIESRQGYRQA
jgi:DeoR/GlpR family transcriptional regulator of sugar metabolism